MSRTSRPTGAKRALKMTCDSDARQGGCVLVTHGTTFLHVSASANRESIERHGLDWSRMGRARGIAGSTRPEVEGIFLCPDDVTVDWFLGFDSVGGPVDVWAVAGVDPADLVTSPEGYEYVPRPIPRSQLTLHRRDAHPTPRTTDESSTAYFSSLTITLVDGRVLRDEEAREVIHRRSSH